MTPFPTRAQRKKIRRAFSKFMSQARAVAATVTSRRQKLFLTHVFFLSSVLFASSLTCYVVSTGGIIAVLTFFGSSPANGTSFYLKTSYDDSTCVQRSLPREDPDTSHAAVAVWSPFLFS